MLSATTLLLATLQAGGLTATVSDPGSHGSLGDSLLSLDEAIRIANGTLAISLLSPAERQAISGGGSSIGLIVIDASVTPTITYQSEITALRSQVVRVSIEGRNGRPILDAGSVSAALKLRSPLVDVSNLSFRNGRTGIDVETLTGSESNAAHLSNLDLSGQSEAGLRLRVAAAPLGQVTALTVERVNLLNMPIGYDLQDQGRNGRLVCISEWIYMFGVTLGVNLASDASGNSSTLQFWRSDFRNGETFIRARRTPSSSQRQEVRVVYGIYDSGKDLVDLQGSASGETVFDHHHADWRTAPDFKLARLYPDTARFDVHGSEMVYDGDLEISAGGNSSRLWLNNNRFRNGRLVVENAGASPMLQWNKFEDYAIEAAVGNTVPLTVEQSELHRTDVIGNSATGGITLDNTFRLGGSVQGSVVERNTAPSTWVTENSIANDFVQLGTPLVLRGTLPPGIAGVWLIGFSAPRPFTASPLFQFYFDPTVVISLRSVLIGNSQLSLIVPNDPQLTRFEYYAQMLTTPVLGQSHVPLVHFPRGARFRIIP